MKIKTKITALLATLTFLASCKESEEYGYHHTVGEENNAITLMAGISEGGAKLQTRAVDGNHAADDTYGGGHTLITTGAKMLLDVRGKWKKTESGEATSVTKTTTITIGGASATEGNGKLHNAITTYDPQLYWDDYGTADPNNKEVGRAEGLTIYGVGVNKDGADVPTINGTSDGKKWTELYWSVGNPSGTPSTIDQSSDWTQYDLITSNNITSSADGTYKFQQYFDDQKKSTNTASNLLVFTHALTKITVNLTAGEGFTESKFASKPSVTLLGFNYIGKVDVENKTTVATKSDYADGAATANINMHLAEGGASNNKAKFEAIVFPGNTFTANIANDADKTATSENTILELDADGNIYKVTAAQLVKAIKGAATGDGLTGTLEKAKNYILHITVNKTKVEVTATVANWTTVTADNETPKINVDKVYGHPTQDGHPAFQKAFDLYRSTSIDGTYTGTGDQSVVSYDGSQYTMSPQLYWPNHNTHYFFRGVWPQVGSIDTDSNPIGPASTQVSTNAIDIENVTYKKDYYPSDLMIGRPLDTDDQTPDETCKVEAHKNSENTYPAGICATEGNVHINFRYVMSQVEVRLETATAQAGEPTPTNAVNLTNAKVEIVNGYTTGKVSLGTLDITDLGTKEDFTLAHIAEEDANYRHSAIVPQTLTYSTVEAQKANNLRFKITIYKNGSTTEVDDIYYADIAPILEKDKTTKVAPEGKWESGKHYIYTLTLSKTAINVTATITDWKEVNASQNIWF